MVMKTQGPTHGASSDETLNISYLVGKIDMNNINFTNLLKEKYNKTTTITKDIIKFKGFCWIIGHDGFGKLKTGCSHHDCVIDSILST